MRINWKMKEVVNLYKVFIMPLYSLIAYEYDIQTGKNKELLEQSMRNSFKKFVLIPKATPKYITQGMIDEKVFFESQCKITEIKLNSRIQRTRVPDERIIGTKEERKEKQVMIPGKRAV